MSRVSSNSGSHFSADRPQSASRPKPADQPQPERSQAEHSSGQGERSAPEQRPERSSQEPGTHISGGVDSRTQFLATQGLKGKKPVTTKADGNIPDSQDENGMTAQQLNTTGPAAKVTDAEISKAAGGDQAIVGVLKKLDTDTEGHKALRLALDKGTTYHQGNLPGNEIGLTESGGGSGPRITLESLSVDTAAHETAHAAYPDMSHAEVYRFGHRVEQRVNGGQTRDSSNDPATTPDQPPSQGAGGHSGGGNRTGGTGGSDGSSGGSSGGSDGGSTGGTSNSGGGGSPGGASGSGGSSGGSGGSGGPTNNTGVNSTIAKLPAAGNITDAQLSEIANGDPKVIAALKLMLKDPDGAKLVQMVIQKHGHIVDDESLSGGTVGEAPVGGNNPTIKIKASALNSTGDMAQTLFHEFTHVSGDPGDANHNSGNDGHDSVYNAQKAFAQRMGLRFAG